MKHLFASRGDFKKSLTGKHLMLFLDYDGTLTPIVETPRKAVFSAGARKLLRRISKKPDCSIAVISGRVLRDVRSKIGLKNIIYSGNHGLEIEGPGIKFRPALPAGYRRSIARIKNVLKKKISSVKGALVEDKGFSLSLHYRLVDKKYTPLLKDIFNAAVIFYLMKKKIKIKSGKKTLQILPPISWDKGKAVLWLLAKQRRVVRRRIFPVYIGDDKTDEDAFRALKYRGMTVFVGKGRRSAAKYYLKNTGQVLEFLRRISNG